EITAFDVVPITFYMSIDLKVTLENSALDDKSEVAFSLWQRHPWSSKQPDYRMAKEKLAREKEGVPIKRDLLKCNKMLGFVGFRKSLYLMITYKDDKRDKTPTMECLLLGIYDSETPLNGTFEYKKDDSRWEKCPKDKDSAIGISGCRDLIEKDLR
ncbi:hypothetical protein PMAYCL1PPCAC_07551, partial [Pristionchus mayeri]